MNRGGRMRKGFLAIILILALSLTSCSKASSETTNKTDANTAATKQEQGNFKRPDVFGKVKSIAGNEVVIQIAKIPQRQQNAQNAQSGQNGKQIAGINGQGSGPVMMSPPSGNTNKSFQVELTDEIVTLMIPVGVPIESLQNGEIKQLDIGDIYEGALLQIWYTDENSKNISRVRMMAGR